ncbi:MAG: L-2-amino-thiazoline-4-carboxylic acid hydrolase [Candidatus Thorarchaeota archaeon]
MVVSRVNRCMWHELQKEYGDPEIAYVNSCHFDFYAATLWNENFVLTRTKTLMQGDDCCDFCWHDKRYDKEMKHPPAKFWDSLK